MKFIKGEHTVAYNHLELTTRVRRNYLIVSVFFALVCLDVVDPTPVL